MQQRIVQVDAVRGIAALLVAVVFHIHIGLGLPHKAGPFDGLPILGWVDDYGTTLVDLFFVLSGFILAHVYLDRNTGELRDGVSIHSFSIARFARLYPLHLATLLMMAALAIIAASRGMRLTYTDQWHFFLNLFFVQASGLNNGYSFNQPAWSLSVEAYCYLIFIFAARARVLRGVAPIAVLVGLLATLSNMVTVDQIARGMVGFFIGTMLWRADHSRWPWPVLALVCILALRIPSGAFHPGALFSLTLWPALVVMALRVPLLATAPMQWLGDRSYSIYLVHWPVYAAATIYFASQPVPDDQLVPVMAVLILTVLVLADVSFRYLEGPARTAIRGIADARGKAAIGTGNPASIA